MSAMWGGLLVKLPNLHVRSDYFRTRPTSLPAESGSRGTRGGESLRVPRFPLLASLESQSLTYPQYRASHHAANAIAS